MVYSYHNHHIETRAVSPKRRLNTLLDTMPASGEVIHNFQRPVPVDPKTALEHQLRESANRRIQALQELEGKRHKEDIANRLDSIEGVSATTKQQSESLIERLTALELKFNSSMEDLEGKLSEKDTKIDQLNKNIITLQETIEQQSIRIATLEHSVESNQTDQLEATVSQAAEHAMTVTTKLENLESRQEDAEGSTADMQIEQKKDIETLNTKIEQLSKTQQEETTAITKRLNVVMTEEEINELKELSKVVSSKLQDLQSKEIALQQQQEASLRGLDAANSALQRLSSQVSVLEGSSAPNHLLMGVPSLSSSGVIGGSSNSINPIRLPASQPFPSSFPTPTAKSQIPLGRAISPPRQQKCSKFPYSATPDAYADILSPH